MLRDQVAIVTGGGQGIGRATALRLAAEAARVIVTDINRQNGEETVRDIGERGTFVHADMGQVDQINELVAKAVADFGKIDILVNNAAVTRSLGFFEVSEADWDWIFPVNARGVFFLMQAAAREMAKHRSGKIINIASLAGKGYPLSSNIAYAGSKGAVLAITRMAAIQLAPHNINVNAVCPGITRTPLWATVMKGTAERTGVTEEEAIRRADSHIPLGRSNPPEEIANAVAFLASAQAANITGQSINVDGGLMFD